MLAAFFDAQRRRDVAPVVGFPPPVGFTLECARRRARGADVGEFQNAPTDEKAAPEMEAAVFRWWLCGYSSSNSRVAMGKMS